LLELLAAEEEEHVRKTLLAALAQLLPLPGNYWKLPKLSARLDILLIRKVVGSTDARSRFVAASNGHDSRERNQNEKIVMEAVGCK